MKKQIEILAPAGSYDGMRAAMNAGCDAVYIGGSSFGARAYANNLEEDALLHAIDEAHLRSKKLYLTVNTLVKENELTEQLYRFLEKFYLQGLDGVIVQDVGVLHFLHRYFPQLKVHASTQMTLTMAQGANLLKDYGVTRLVTARELSLAEIRTIRANTELEIETFVHGALCYCYSGQCLMSSMIGGRSGNRGRCAQPCRMPYQFFSEGRKISSDQEKYLLSPKDINTISIIPELVEAGIDSFKIEGRMKRPEYAAAVSQLYRKYTDLYFSLGKDDYHRFVNGNDFKKDLIQLQDVFNRGGFSEGYGKTYHSRKMMSLSRPNHSGVYVGEVVSVKGSQVKISLKESVNAQDVLEIREKEEEGYEFTVKDFTAQGEVLTTNVGSRPVIKGKDTIKQEIGKRETRVQEMRGGDSKIEWSEKPTINLGNRVYRTKNNVLLDHIASEYMNKDQKQGIKGLLKARAGEKLSLTITFEDHLVNVYHDIVQEALKQPMTKEKLSAPVTKTGDTLYFFEELEVDMGDNIFVPVAWLNEIRRDAIRMLEDAITEGFRRNGEDNRESKFNEEGSRENSKKETIAKQDDIIKAGVCVSVQTKDQFGLALTFEDVTSIYVEYDTLDRNDIVVMANAAKEAAKGFYVTLPHICRLTVYEKLEQDLSIINQEENVTGFVVKNFEEIELLRSLYKKEKVQKEIVLNHNMYVYNREAKMFWKEMGISHFTSPVELNYQELLNLGILDCDLIVYGYLPLMVSAQCLYESTEGCRKGKLVGANNSGYLLDRLGKKFFVQTNCKGCYNLIYNGQCLSLLKQAIEIRRLRPRNIRLDFTLESKEEMKRAFTAFMDNFFHGRESGLELENNTTGYFKRKVE